jgi:hypothetical protein
MGPTRFLREHRRAKADGGRLRLVEITYVNSQSGFVE